jgi:hypothetical protein
LGVLLGVERALFQDPGMVHKEKCDAKRIKSVEHMEKLRAAKDQQR